MVEATEKRRGPGVPPELADKLVIMADACKRLNCSRWTIYRLIKQGRLAKSPHRIGASIAITAKSLEAHLRRLGQGA